MLADTHGNIDAEKENDEFGITLERRAQIVAELVGLEKSRAFAVEDAQRRIEDARQKDVDNALHISDVLYNTELQYEQQSRDSLRRQLDDYAKWAARHILLTTQHSARLIYESASLDQQEESARHVREMAQLRADEEALKRAAFTEAVKLKIEQTFNGFREAENQRHIDEQNRINKQADEATKAASGDSEGGTTLTTLPSKTPMRIRASLKGAASVAAKGD